MIGVIADPAAHDVVHEFFELFKAPWEFVHIGRTYDAVVSDGSSGVVHEHASPVVVLYSGRLLSHDPYGATLSPHDGYRELAYEGLTLPLAGNCMRFPGIQPGILVDAESRQAVIHLENRNTEVFIRVGYDLFSEVRRLLSSTQPARYALSPSLDIHIAVLRDLLIMQRVPFVEIPPVPPGYKLVACLTHDVDHPSIRQHRCDHTMFGFLYRAIVLSLIDIARRRGDVRTLLRNWWAACKLPFVYLGLAEDFWLTFDRYLELEAGHPSTFFVIPFKARPGRRGAHSAPARRAARYDLAAIERPLRRIIEAGCEIGLHGLDAWHDVFQGREELRKVRQIAGDNTRGVRMHWLYFDQRSPATLERVGLSYDSSVGFNEAVGYRAGTTQVYKPLDTAELLELPLQIMDTALFYPVYMNQSREEAMEHVKHMIGNAVRFGGCVTVNWHDRSISPERCWDGFYVQIIEELEKNGAWFATARDAVSWFRRRRAVACDEIAMTPNHAKADDTLPGLQCRRYGDAACATSIPAR